jgi:hypothetical protein
VLGSQVVGGHHPVTPGNGGGTTQVLDDGDVAQTAHHGSQGETVGRGVESREQGQAQGPGPERAGDDAAGEAAHDGEVARQRVERLEDRNAVEDHGRRRQEPGAENRPHQAPDDGGLVGGGVEAPPPNLAGGQGRSGHEADTGEHTVE